MSNATKIDAQSDTTIDVLTQDQHKLSLTYTTRTTRPLLKTPKLPAFTVHHPGSQLRTLAISKAKQSHCIIFHSSFLPPPPPSTNMTKASSAQRQKRGYLQRKLKLISNPTHQPSFPPHPTLIFVPPEYPNPKYNTSKAQKHTHVNHQEQNVKKKKFHHPLFTQPHDVLTPATPQPAYPYPPSNPSATSANPAYAPAAQSAAAEDTRRISTQATACTLGIASRGSPKRGGCTR